MLPRQTRALAESQFGVIARRQLLDGLTAGQADGIVRRGRLETVHRGVYRVPGSPETPEQEAMAAVLRIGRARVAGPFVLGLYGAEGFSRDDPFRILRHPERRQPRNVSFSVVEDPCPDRTGRRWVGLPMLPPALSCIDAACPEWEISDRALRVGVDTMRWSGRTSTNALRDEAERLPHHPGSRRVLGLLSDGDLVAESEAERRVSEMLEPLTPAPVLQARVSGYRADFLWPEVRCILEFDGRVHDRPERRDHDRERDRKLEDAGYDVHRVRWQDLDDPQTFRAWILQALRIRAREVGTDPAVFQLES